LTKEYLSLKELIDQKSMSGFQILMVAMCFILNMNDGIDVLIVSFSGSDIAAEMSLTKAQLGYVFSTGLAGMTTGALGIAPLADKIGRRRIFILSLVLITTGMLLVWFCEKYTQFLMLRFITGLGIGGILPAMAATASEFSNQKNRDFNVSLVQAGWPIGAIFTGLFCSYTIPQYGWRYAFLFAAGVSFLMLIAVILFMTDSLDYLVKKQPAHAFEKMNVLLQKLHLTPVNQLPEKPLETSEKPLKSLFTAEFKTDTYKLWIAVFFGFLTLYTIMSWVPNIAKDSGLPFEMATYVGIALNIGAALGTIGLGLVSKRLGLKKTVLFFMLSAFIVMIVYGNITLSPYLIFALIFLIGISVQGGFNGIYPTLARVYPTEIRSTGVGFAVGIGRFGAILGPSIFGLLSDQNLSTGALFTVFSVPLVIMGLSVYSLKSQRLKNNL
jgi:MFS transporter, AAHS family, 4-hydroxybenzoate transporter